MKGLNPSHGVLNAKVIQVIVTSNGRGAGTDDDPCRIVQQYWDFDGTLLAVMDPVQYDLSQIIKRNRALLNEKSSHDGGNHT